MAAPERVIAHLEPLLTPQRAERMRGVLATRSDHVAFVFEHMIDPHNLSAALRSLDAFSFQDVYAVHPGERLGLSPGITIGAERWLSLHLPDTTAECLDALRGAGYRVYASHLDAAATPLTAIDFGERVALVFGNEHAGVSDAVLTHADGRFRIDMPGFAQSLNLSVSVAISAWHARREIERRRAADPDPARFALSPERQAALYADWLWRSVKHAERILAEATD